MEALVALLVMLLLDLVVLHWGKSSIEEVDSPEWARRRAWRGFGR